MSVRGSRSIAEARRVLLEAARQVVATGPVRIRRFRVRNIVVTTDYGRLLDLDRIAEESIFESSEYEPEFFPGITLRFPGSKCTARVFSSGKGVIVGARSLAEVRETIGRISEALTRV